MERNLDKCLLFAGMSASEIYDLLKNCSGERTFDKQDIILSQ